jgi:5,10-methylenetetrahydromethanopterin reductase
MSKDSIGFVTLGDIPVPRLAELAKLAEGKGFSSVWITDEPFFRGAFPSAVACAMTTEQIRIGLGVVNPYDHPPVWMAKDFATLQELAGPRTILGIGASWEPPIAAQGIEWTKPLSAVRDSVFIARTLLAGETSSYKGKKFRVDDVKLSFEPSVKESTIMIGSMFPKSLAQTGEIADGVIFSILCPVPYVQTASNYIEQGAERVERTLDDFEIIQFFPMEVSEDGETAKQSVKRHIGFFIQHSYGSDPDHWLKVAELGKFDIKAFANIYEALENGENPEEVVSDEFLSRFAIAGTPEECLDTLAQYKDAGTTEPVALFPSWANLEEQISLLGERVAPEWARL